MICKKCGKEIVENETFCRFCGTTVNEKKKTFKLNIQDEEFLRQTESGSSEKLENINITEEKPVFKTKQTVDQLAEQNASEQEEPAVQAEFTETKNSEKSQQKAAYESEDIYVLEAQSNDDTSASPNSKLMQTGENQNRQPKQNNMNAALPEIRQAEYSNSRYVQHNQDDFRTSRKKKNRAGKQNKYDRTAKAIVCVCAVIIAALTVLSIKTDFFEGSNDKKTVALSKLSNEQVASFESYAPTWAALFGEEYDSSRAVLDDVMPLMNPSSENGLYAGFFDAEQTVTDSADPAKRYISETETSGYCSVDAGRISEIAQGIGLESHNDINTADYYYYNGKYYFKPQQDEQSNGVTGVVKVTESKKTSDGDFYVTCDVFDEDAQQDEKGNYLEPALSKLYFIVSADGEADSTVWTLKRVSSKPIFGADSDDDDPENAGKSLDFEMKREKFSAKTSDGKVYANYVVEYPYFENNGTTALTINSIYEATIDELKSRVNQKKVDRRYTRFLNSGGSEDDLPLYTHVIASVEYNEDGYISILERRTMHNGLEGKDSNAEQTTTSSYYGQSTETTQTQQESEEVFFPRSTYEGYTYEIETGEFVKKDDLLGKDYFSIQTQLYNSWQTNGGKMLPKDEFYGNMLETYETNEIAQSIYESSWIMTDDSVEFSFQHADGALDIVKIARSNIETQEETVSSESYESEQTSALQ